MGRNTGPAPADLSVAISDGALGVSLSTFVISRYRDRRDLLLKLLDRLATTEQQDGRRLIHQMGSTGVNIDNLTTEQYAQINNAFAALNTLGIYYQRRYLRRKDVLALFALNVARVYRDGQEESASASRAAPAGECLPGPSAAPTRRLCGCGGPGSRSDR